MAGKDATADPRLRKIWRTSPHLAIAAARLIPGLLFLFSLLANAAAQEISPDLIEVSGNSIYRWQIGAADASLLEGDCVLQHGEQRIMADSILLVVDGPIGRVRSRVVIAGLKTSGGIATEPTTFTFLNLNDPRILFTPVFKGKPKTPPALLRYLPANPSIDSPGLPIQRASIQQVQFSEPVLAPPQLGSPPLSPPQSAPSSVTFMTGGGTRSVEIVGRGASMSTQIQSIPRPELGETVIVARGGVTVLVRDVSAQLSSGEIMELGTISLSADRVVGWFPGLLTDLFTGGADLSQTEGELYLEGDIVFRQGERIIYAESMYYNVNSQTGMILDAEAITTIPEYQGIVRLKAEVLQQVLRGNFRAFDAAVTSSRMGVPRYWLQSERLQLTDRERLVTDPTTGFTTLDREPFVESNNNFVYLAGIPVLYWPTISTSLQQPAYYVTGIKTRSDGNFGTQVLLDFDLFQVFGIENKPQGVDWELSTDYFSDRGPAIGTTLQYSLPGLFGVPGPVKGYFDTWYIHDRGLDTLGRDRVNLTPETRNRGRSLLRHRHYLPNDYELIAQIGWISDRNFLEQYLENEWDQELNHRTGLQLRKYFHSHMFDLTANAQVNDFFTTTEQLPTLDHYMIGGSVFADRLTWSAHNKVGYERLNVGTLPTDPAEAALYTSPLPGEMNAKGVVASTRQELAMPVQVGPLKIVPNVSGEAAHYGEAADGDSLTRLLGQAGIRTSLSAWRVDPTIQSSLLNVRGLAHKVEWTAEYFYADSDTNLDELPLYDPLDDHAQQQFRNRFVTEEFGGTLPAPFDPRTYALRHGFQQLVASPSDVIADDLQQVRVGMHQRWQTKRGLPGRERIADLMRFDIDLLVFPDAARDNFGETVGPLVYDTQYNIGDRVTLLSDGYIDFFDSGLRSINAGFRTSRPGVGDIYMGLLSIDGPVSSTVLNSTLNYRMNEKWITTAGTTYDFGPTGNVGQSLALNADRGISSAAIGNRRRRRP